MVYAKSEEVAEFFLNKSKMTNKKLQKIVYYAYVWTLVLLNDFEDNTISNRLFSDNIEAWVHGPVIPLLYNKYKDYGWTLIPSTQQNTIYLTDVEKVLNDVWEVYGKYTADELENISHQEEPWLKARGSLNVSQYCNVSITDADIFAYYTKRIV